MFRRTPNPAPALRPTERRRQQFVALSMRGAAVLATFGVCDLVAIFGFGHREFIGPALTFAAWIGINIALVSIARRLEKASHLEWIFVLSFCKDIAGSIAVHWYAGGGWWLGALFLGVILVVAMTMLEANQAAFITAVATAAWAVLIWVQAIGIASPEPFFGLPSLRGNFPLAIAEVAFGTIGLGALVLMQRAQMRSMRRSEESWRLLVDTAPDMILTMDLERRILSVNDTVLRTMGYDREALVGRKVTDFTDGDIELVNEQYASVVQGGTSRFEHRYRRADGSSGWMEVSAAAVREGEIAIGFLATAREITADRQAAEEREQLQQELAQAQRMQTVGRLVSGVAHELNNPLMGIMAFTSQLIEEARTEEDRKILTLVHTQALRSRDIVRDLLAVVRKREGRPAEQVGWPDVVARMEAMLRAEVARLEGRLLVETIPAQAVVKADRTGLEQVLTNLVLNGAQAAGNGGTVTVRAAVFAEFCQLIVEDSGPGIPTDVISRVFEPFFSTKPEGQGSGLGLSVSLGIIEQAGGTIRAQNRPPEEGGGARFVVTLPIESAATRAATSSDAAPLSTVIGAPVPVPVLSAAAREAPVPPSRPIPAPPVVSPARPLEPPTDSMPAVLIVDDEATIRVALRRYFVRRGWHVVEAEDGAVALNAIRQGALNPDVIISDLRMPGIGGVELYRELAHTAPHLLRRLIISTGDVASAEAADFLEHADCVVLEKPFDLSALGQTVDGIVAKAGRVAA